MNAEEKRLIENAIRELNYEGYHDEAKAVERLLARAVPVAAPVAMPAASVQPDAEAYSDMLREFFCQYAAGGYNDNGGLVPLDKCRDKLAWIIEDQRAHAARQPDSVQPVDKGVQAEQANAWGAVVEALNEHSFGWQHLTNRGMDSAVEAIRLMATRKPDSRRDAALVVKTWQERAREHKTKLLRLPPPNEDFMRLEIVELRAALAAPPANGAQADLVAKINALRVRGVNYEDGVPARQRVDRAEVLALLGGAS